MGLKRKDGALCIGGGLVWGGRGVTLTARTGANVALVVGIMSMVVSSCLSRGPACPPPPSHASPRNPRFTVWLLWLGRQLSLIWFIRFAQVMIRSREYPPFTEIKEQPSAVTLPLPPSCSCLPLLLFLSPREALAAITCCCLCCIVGLLATLLPVLWHCVLQKCSRLLGPCPGCVGNWPSSTYH
jgi:hypothetical protein